MERTLLLDLGMMPYGAAWELQKQVWQLRVEGRIPDTLILVEHPPVITLGKSGKASNLLVPEDELKRRGVELFRVERGGDITYHGPGQLVGYPIFFIREAIAGVRAFVTQVEESLVRVLSAHGIAAKGQTSRRGLGAGTEVPERIQPARPERRRELTGVWVGNEKIAALGIAVSRRVSFHGFALNVNADLSAFQLINPCGLSDKGVTSMERVLGRKQSMPTVKHEVASAFESVFDRELALTSRERVLKLSQDSRIQGLEDSRSREEPLIP
jgi:lipoyl(octanoyl) transferase